MPFLFPLKLKSEQMFISAVFFTVGKMKEIPYFKKCFNEIRHSSTVTVDGIWQQSVYIGVLPYLLSFTWILCDSL